MAFDCHCKLVVGEPENYELAAAVDHIEDSLLVAEVNSKQTTVNRKSHIKLISM